MKLVFDSVEVRRWLAGKWLPLFYLSAIIVLSVMLVYNALNPAPRPLLPDTVCEATELLGRKVILCEDVRDWMQKYQSKSKGLWQ